MGGEGNLLRIAQKKINLTIRTNGDWDTQNSLGFRDTNRSFNHGQTTRPNPSQKKKKEKKKRTYRIVDVAAPADHRMKWEINT